MARVLVVDDMPDARAFLRAVLHGVGHDVAEAADGVEALEVLRSGGVDLVVSDGLMPRMDGFRLCLEMRRDPALAGVPFIFHTASFTHGDDQRLAEQLGAEAYLVKPVPFERIIETVDAALGPSADKVAGPIGEAALVALLERYGERLESKLDRKVVQLGEAVGVRESFRMLLDNLPLLVVTFATGGSIDYYNRVALQFSGEQDRGGEGFLAVGSHDDAERFLVAARRALADEAPGEVTLRLRRRDRRWRTVRFALTPYYGQDGECLGVVAAGLDVTEEEEHTGLLRYLAEHDPLTDLPNRRALDARFEEILQCVAAGRRCAVLFIDIDRFKSVNDDFGHDAGDAALVSVARVLVSCAGEDDLVVRLCGDEFAVMAEGAGWEEAEGLAERIRASVSETPLVPGAPDRRLTVSIGVTVVPDVASPVEALRDSDRAMYSAKAEGRDRTVLGRERESEETASERRRPLLDAGIALRFSPVYSIATGELARCAVRTSFEAEGERLGDEEYMIEAARHGVARSAGRHAIEAAMDAMSGSDRACSVRLWLSDLLDPSVFAWLEEAMSRRGLEPRHFGLQVTAAHILGSGLSATWQRAAERSRVRLILDVTGPELARLGGIGLDSFDEVVVPIGVLREGTGQQHQRESVLLSMTGDDRESTVTGVESRELLAYAVELGVDNAEGSVLGRTSDRLADVSARIGGV